MSTRTTGVFLILLLGLFSAITASPLEDMTEDDSSADGAIGNDLPNNEEQPTSPPILFNEYLLEAYKVTWQVSVTTCTKDVMIFNQSVSEHFCESNKTVYSFLNVSAANTSERVMRPTNLQNTYQLCSNVNLRSGDTVLGHDFILYLRPPTESVKLDIFFLRTVNVTSPWEELVANRSIPFNASGWQVLNLKSVVEPIVQSTACVDMYVGETNANNQRTLLNQTQIAERFVLNDCAPDETAILPFAATYMSGGISLPIGKRSVGASHPNQCSRDTNCSVQYRRADLNDHLPPDIIYPHQADLGQCGGIFTANSHHLAMDRQEKQEEKQESTVGEDSSQEGLYQCIPNNYRDLLVLRNVAFELVLELIPDFVTTGCTLQSCGSEI